MAMSGFICHDDYLQKTERLTDEQFGRVFRALIKYHAHKEEPNLDALESMAFDFIRVDIDRTEKEYNDKCEKNRQTRLDAIEKNRQRTLTNVDERSQEKKRKEKEKEKEKNNSVFTPPTVAEVDAYCRERNNGIDPEYFVDYQTARNWILSNGKKCKDWRATVRTWEKNGYNNRSSPKKINAQDYEQRDYSGEQEDAMRRMIAGVNANAG